MEKKSRLIPSGLLLLFVLASCGGQSSSSSQSTGSAPTSSSVTSQSQSTGQSSSTQSSSDPVTDDWSEDTKAKLRGALHGVVIPYVPTEVTIEFKCENKGVKMMGTGSLPDGFLAEYAAKYLQADGWEGGSMDEDEEQPTGAIYGFRKKVTTDAGDRYVVIAFAARDASGNLDKNGTFCLEGSDPYEYSYPSKLVSDYVTNDFGGTVVPPAFTAEFYGLDKEGELACHNAAATSEDTYKAALLATGHFTISEQKDANGCWRANPSDNAYTLLFYFSEPEETFYIIVGPHLGWNAKAIEAFFEKYHATPYEIPAMSGEYFGFKFNVVKDDEPGKEAGRIVLTDFMPTSAEEYATKLVAAGYVIPKGTVFEEGKNTKVTATLLADEGIASLSLDYDGTAHTLVIGLSNARDKSKTKAWPAEELARDIALTQDTIPAYLGANLGFSYATIEGKSIVTVYIQDMDVEEAKGNYVTQLEGAGYVESGTDQGQSRYRSANSEVSVTIAHDSAEPGQIRLQFQSLSSN